MVVSCWVSGCYSRFGGSVRYGFYSIPIVRLRECDKTKRLSEERRRLWLARINRKDEPSKYAKICSEHFVSGKPADLFDHTNPDWAPSLKLGGNCTPRKLERKVKEATPSTEGYVQAEKTEASKAASALPKPPATTTSDTELEDVTDVAARPNCSFVKLGRMESPKRPDADHLKLLTPDVQDEIQCLLSENALLKLQLKTLWMTQDVLADRQDLVTYYTGLPSFDVLKMIYDDVEPHLPPTRLNDRGKFERLVMTLSRMKLNTPLQDLAYRFQTSTATASRIFLVYVRVLYARLKHLIRWPTRGQLRETIPTEFWKHLGEKTAVIVDCFEIPIRRPKNLMATAIPWSAYKRSSTVKFLVGMTPQGSVSFLSRAWGGRTSDKHIAENCGLLTNLLPGDLVLADRGFDIPDSAGFYCAQVDIPSSTRGKSQLSALGVEHTRKIPHVRTHIERVVGLVRNKYTILQSKLPIDILMTENEDLPVIDKIACVACCLSNLSFGPFQLNI